MPDTQSLDMLLSVTRIEEHFLDTEVMEVNRIDYHALMVLTF